ncbi:stAR-related lipid transfer protein 8 isoform X1 [Anguilla anguilla]|uniref:stAR-related lipid transfer protein 8 isoform X1 n=1 Tax=Anguilla anguilla TaxID=7936 RepID=UPI0015B37322|nr:stAR-related lipid transfer protein 8 isoform X1 [Anguilla anguilla]
MERKTWTRLRPRSLTVHFRDSTYKALTLLRRKSNQRQLEELEAKEACNWLRAAGFPQYAQLYEDALFPIDIPSVKKDHDFLDRDSLKSLCRRLTTLNKCASMKLEVHFQRKQSEDSEEDDLCAISDRWAFQRDSKRWSRLRTLSPPNGDGLSSSARTSASSESVLSDFSDLEISSVRSGSSLSACSARGASSSDATVAEPDGALSEPDRLAPSGEEATGAPRARPCLREKAKRSSRGFLRRIESFRRKDREKEVADVGEGPAPPSPSPASLHCTPNESLPGLKQSSLLFSRRARTICRTRVGQSDEKGPGRTKRNARYLEDYEMGPRTPDWKELVTGLGSRQDKCLVHLPEDHKPGTFPRSLSIESLRPLADDNLRRWRVGELDLSVASSSDSCLEGLRQRRNSCSSVGSIYDNVPALFDSSEELFGLEGEKVFRHLNDVLQHVHDVQQNVDLWSKRVCLELGDRDDEEDSEEKGETSYTPGLRYEERSMSDVGTAVSDYDSMGNSLNEAEEMQMRERRDSGVGASLTRPSRKLRWHSFQNSHRPSLTSASLEINRQSAAQLNLLQKFSLLRLTAIMEKYCLSSKHGWSWTVPKFMKRSKVPDYRDRNVFGVPPIINVQRSGQPLPQSIQQAMRYIRSQCLDQVGIFRKSGVKSRIQALRQLNENSPDHVSYEGQSAYDVADMLKQYFRDLPEPVFTSKLTETFLQIYQCVPKDQCLQAVQAAVILLPDENREVLQTLLYFLSDIASAQGNQMTAGNLAVCLAPSVFHLNVSKKEGTSPRLIRRRGAAGKPDQKDLNENMAATQGLSHMIAECKKLFQIPHDMMLQSRNSYIAADAQPLPLHGLGCSLKGEPVDYQAYLEESIQCLLRDTTERSKGWHSAPGPENTELSYKKVGDGHPIRLWKVSTEIEAPPAAVLHRVLRERHLWDDDLLHSRVIESLENDTEVYHYVTDSMAPHPRRDFVVLRRWNSSLPRGCALLVSSSVEHDKDKVFLQAGLRAVLLTSRCLIEPSGAGRSCLTHYCRADLRGRSPEWYNKVFGHLCAVEVARIRDSFPVLAARGLETKL